jgi:hypothetical protein
MSWGIRIAILYGAFVVMILFLVFKTMNENIDLVSPEYYQEELKFQDQIDRQRQSASLTEQPAIELREKNVAIKFPKSVASSTISGTIKFYRPSDSSKDFTTEVHADSSGMQMVSAEKLITGIYEVQLSWSAGGKNYYNTYSLYIP